MRALVITATMFAIATTGCAVDTADAGDEVGRGASALACDGEEDTPVDCPLPQSRSVYRLIGLQGTTLTGVNGRGETFTADFTEFTNFQRAKADQYPPQPILPIVTAYNDAVASGGDVLAVLQQYVALEGHALVTWPPQPVRPPDPVLPLRSIHVFKPVPPR